LIVAALAAAPTDEVRTNERPEASPQYAEAITVFECDFEADADKDLDEWPDLWTRRRGKQFPHYLPIGIRQEPSASGGRCLKIDLDGGAAIVHSPPIEIGVLHSYALEARLKTEELHRSRAIVSLTFYDDERQPLETVYSRPFVDAPIWEKVEIGPVTPPGERAHFAVIGLHLVPGPEGGDLRGAALFDQVRLVRLPRMRISTNSPFGVFTALDAAEIRCELSGAAEARPTIRFELRDVEGTTLATHDMPLAGQRTEHRPADEYDSAPTGSHPPGYRGEVRWKPPIQQHGFYTVSVVASGSGGLIHRGATSLCFLREAASADSGEFGWSLPQGDRPMPLADLARLLPLAGVRWVKYPVWEAVGDPDRVDRLAWLAERLGDRQIEMVALLHRPPKAVLAMLPAGQEVSAATIFSTESQLWFPSLEPLLTRLSLKIRYWQLGLDDDASFIGAENLVQRLAKVKGRLERFGQEVHLGIGWRWIHELPKADRPPWEFFTLSARPQLSGRELAAYLQSPSPEGVRRWVSVDPLAKDDYCLEVRAADLAQRLLAARKGGAEAIFLSDPFDPSLDVMRPGPSPGAMLVPWRSMATALGGATHLGSIAMPGGSHNEVFVRGDKAVMVVWADRPTEETLYLGEDIQHLDLWGRPLPVERREHQQALRVGPMPTIVLGVNPAVARWRIGFQFTPERLPSEFGQPHALRYRVTNPFDVGAGGRMTLVAPDQWRTEPRTSRLSFAPGETVEGQCTVTLPLDASSGNHEVRVDFQVSADRDYRFSVWRHVGVGLGDVLLEATARFADDGSLEIEQQLSNNTDRPARFKCYLYAPGRQRQQALSEPLAQGQQRTRFVLRDARDLAGGKLWLQAQEVGGRRVLNYRIDVPE